MEDITCSVVNQLRFFDYKGVINTKILGNSPYVKKKVIGFQVNGIGNGHLTQAKVVYDILIKHYDIPIVIVYCRKDTNGTPFESSEIVFQQHVSTPDSTNSGDIVSHIADYISIKPTQMYENSHKINMWLNFFISDLGNFRTTQLMIATQNSTHNPKMLASFLFAQTMSTVKLISIMKSSMITDYVLPPLIDITTSSWEPRPNHILCYSVSGNDFPRTLKTIATQYPSHKFDYFINYDHKYSMPSNVITHQTSKKVFKEHLQKASAVLCTSGHELIQECVYFGLPVATMMCSETQEEQVENCKHYVVRKWCLKMTKDLDINTLTTRDMSQQRGEILKLLEGREQIIIKMIEEC